MGAGTGLASGDLPMALPFSTLCGLPHGASFRRQQRGEGCLSPRPLLGTTPKRVRPLHGTTQNYTDPVHVTRLHCK